MCLAGAAVTFRLAHFYQRALATALKEGLVSVPREIELRLNPPKSYVVPFVSRLSDRHRRNRGLGLRRSAAPGGFSVNGSSHPTVNCRDSGRSRIGNMMGRSRGLNMATPDIRTERAISPATAPDTETAADTSPQPGKTAAEGASRVVSHSVDDCRIGCCRHRRPLDLVPGAASTPAGAGRGGHNAARHRGAGRGPCRGDPGCARPGRRRRRRAGADRQSRDAGKARPGAGRQGGRRGAAREHQRRHAGGGDRGAQGRARAGAGERGPGQEDLRPHQPAGRAWQCAAGASRPATTLRRKRARGGPGQIGHEQAVNG